MAEYPEQHPLRQRAQWGLNGFQFSYGIPAEQIQVVVQAYASANAATYDDEIWEKYQFGELLNVIDPETKKPAERNIWAKSSISADDLEETPRRGMTPTTPTPASRVYTGEGCCS